MPAVSPRRRAWSATTASPITSMTTRTARRAPGSSISFPSSCVEDWAAIEAAVIQRATLADLILRDIYGPQKLIAGGHVAAASGSRPSAIPAPADAVPSPRAACMCIFTPPIWPARPTVIGRCCPAAPMRQAGWAMRWRTGSSSARPSPICLPTCRVRGWRRSSTPIAKAAWSWAHRAATAPCC